MSHMPKVDDICTTHHPCSKRLPTVESFATYGQTTHSQASCIKAKPWLSFYSESEFEFANITLETAMSHPQVNALINIVQKIVAGDIFKVKITMRSMLSGNLLLAIYLWCVCFVHEGFFVLI